MIFLSLIVNARSIEMEAKLSPKQEFPLLKSNIRRVSPNPTSLPDRFRLKSLGSDNRLLTKSKRFQELAERWKFQVQELSKGHGTKQFLVHLVKEGESLTSISRQYGVSIKAIAAVNTGIIDVDLVLEGQHLNIPSTYVRKENQIVRSMKSSLSHIDDVHKRCHRAMNYLGGQEKHKILTVLSSNRVLLAKTTGYFLVLVPLIAFSIRCIIGAFQHRVAKDLKSQAINKAHHLGSRGMRWKSALRDIREPDDLDESEQEFSNTSEDQSQVPYEEISHSYSKLEPAYQKFLSECGMSKWGYWRGGSPE